MESPCLSGVQHSRPYDETFSQITSVGHVTAKTSKMSSQNIENVTTTLPIMLLTNLTDALEYALGLY